MIPEACKARSMFEEKRWALLESILAAGLPDGHLYEFGCGKAGVAAFLAVKFPLRSVIACDRFGKGCTALHEKDMPSHLHEGCFGDTDFEEVRAFLPRNVIPVNCDLSELVPGVAHVALAVVDLNLYEPTLNVLNRIIPYMAKGGTILVDDWDYPGVYAALCECGVCFTRNGYMGVWKNE